MLSRDGQPYLLRRQQQQQPSPTVDEPSSTRRSRSQPAAAPLSDARAQYEAKSWYTDEMARSIRERIATLEVAERVYYRREQQLAVREVTLQRALSAAPNGPVKDWEQRVDAFVRIAASKLDPPDPPVAGFLRELEDRAVQLECSLHHLRHRLLDVSRQEDALRVRAAKVEVQAAETAAKREHQHAMCIELDRRDSVLRQKALELTEYEAELSQWADRLRDREADSAQRELTDDSFPPPAAASSSSGPSWKRQPQTPLSDDVGIESRAQLAEVAQYLQSQFAALEETKSWLQLRVAAVDEATRRLHALHVEVDHSDVQPPPMPPVDPEVHPLLATFAQLAVPLKPYAHLS